MRASCSIGVRCPDHTLQRPVGPPGRPRPRVRPPHPRRGRTPSPGSHPMDPQLVGGHGLIQQGRHDRALDTRDLAGRRCSAGRRSRRAVQPVRRGPPPRGCGCRSRTSRPDASGSVAACRRPVDSPSRGQEDHLRGEMEDELPPCTERPLEIPGSTRRSARSGRRPGRWRRRWSRDRRPQGPRFPR
jgi:hypothetical protein